MLKYVLGIAVVGLSYALGHKVGYRKGKKVGLGIGLMEPPTPKSSKPVTRKKKTESIKKPKPIILIPKNNIRM